MRCSISSTAVGFNHNFILSMVAWLKLISTSILSNKYYTQATSFVERLRPQLIGEKSIKEVISYPNMPCIVVKCCIAMGCL